MSETKKIRPDETGAEISGAPSTGGAPLSVPLFFSSDINVARITSVTSEESRLDTNYFYSRPTHALIYKVSGTMVCYYKDAKTGKAKELEFSKNDIVYIPKGMTYRSRLKSEGRYIIINFETADVYPAEDIFAASFENHSNLYSLFSKCAEEWLFKDSAHILSCKSYVYKILALMARALDGSDAATRRRIAPSLEYLHSHISDPSLDTPKLAAASDLSVAQFRRLFEKIYIVPPRRYIISVRISAAKDLLENQTGVAETAKIVGFTDAESFSRLFKRETGVTPYDFLKNGDPAKRS